MIRLDVDRLPSGALLKPVWLWHSAFDDPNETRCAPLLSESPARIGCTGRH